MFKLIRGLFDWLARMGLSIRDDPPKQVDLAGRQWGEPADGLALSLAQRDAILSVVLRNVSNRPIRLSVPEFSHFYKLEVSGAERTAFGRQLLSAETSSLRLVELGPGEPVEAEMPIQSMYRLDQSSLYAAIASCVLPSGEALRSNSIRFVLKA